MEKTKRNHVLITGATGGLGKAFAVECASRGWDLFLTDLNDATLAVLAEGLQKTYGVEVITYACDLTDEDARAKLCETLYKNNWRFGILINVAGTDYEGPFYERTREQIRTIVRLNIEGTLEMTHAVMGIRDPYTTLLIINVASLAAFYPMPVKAIYAASKRFILDFTLALREEVRPLGATVTALCPAGLPTNKECIQGIEAQGLIGQLTTQNIGSVAAMTVDYALKGRAVCIPGLLNQIFQFLGNLLPSSFLAWLIGRRWQETHQKSQESPAWRATAHQVEL